MIPVLGTLKFITRHPLSSRRPLAALYRYAWWQAASRLQNEIEFDWIDGAKLVVRRGMTGVTGNIYCGLHEFNDMAFLLHFLRPGDLFVDACANVGSYMVLAAAVCGADVIAVEPDPETMKNLKANVDVNRVGPQVQLAQIALGDDVGVIRFTVGHDTMNRVATEHDSATREVPLQRLDNLVAGRAPKMLKMDVEGFEAAVVRGAGGLIASDGLAAILTESFESDVRLPLERHGFRRAFYEPFARQLSLSKDNFNSGGNNALYVRGADNLSRLLREAPRRQIAGVTV